MKRLKIYFAGDLFDGKDLGGNVMLADSIEQCSGLRYQVMLPQNGECEVLDRTSQSIRDADFELLFQCDVMVANFDGHDLDSGTVVEFCFAKMIDMPTVLLRTDFRNSGDHSLPDGDPWNLMCSHYPRTEVLHINSMQRYHQCCLGGSDPASCLEKFYNSIAGEVISALDRQTAMPPWLEKTQVLDQYRRAVKSIGGTLSRRLPEEKLLQMTASKIASGIY